MATTEPVVAEGDICPDPSAHGPINDARLRDQASKAALYVTKSSEHHGDAERSSALGPDGKLSSAGAAASIKYAKAQDLPSYPVVGIDTTHSGNAAANIAAANSKPLELWKPELSSSAGKAALLAHKDGGKLDLWSPSSSDTGHTAAGAAMGKRAGLAPQPDFGYTEDGHKKALLAATLSVSKRNRDRSTSTPEPAPRYPDAENAGHNALNAATVAHGPTPPRSSGEEVRVSSPANEAARLTHLHGNINRDMFTDHPHFDIAPNPHRHSHALAGASLAATNSARASQEVDRGPSISAQAQNYARLDLQEQAQKLAQERLSKLDPDGVRAYREHYGYPSGQQRSRLSVRNRRARSSSGGTGRNRDDEDEDDATRAGRIRSQMNRFNDQLASVDAQKRKADRTTLMAAAEKSVRQRMSTLDQQIFDETGKVSPAMMEQWEAKARERAVAQSEKRMEHHGMVDLGGGKFMDKSEVDKIAANRMQPTLDEIDRNAEKQRAREEEIRLDQERRKEEAAVEKQREKETKAETKKARQEEKEYAKVEKRLHKEEVKQEKAAHKEQEKATQKEHGKEAKRQSEERDTATKTSTEEGDTKELAGAKGNTGAGAQKRPTQKLTKGEKAALQPSTEEPPGVPINFDGKPSGGYQREQQKLLDEAGGAGVEEAVQNLDEVQTVEGPTVKRDTKRDSRVRSWLSKLKRTSKQTQPSDDTERTDAGAAEKAEAEHGLYSHYKEAKEDDDEENAAAHKSKPTEEPKQTEEPSPPPEEPLSPTTAGNIDKYLGREVEKKLRDRSVSPPSVRSGQFPLDGKRVVASVGDEEVEEAKDTFDDDALKAPPEPRLGGRKDHSPSRTASKFTEDL